MAVGFMTVSWVDEASSRAVSLKILTVAPHWIPGLRSGRAWLMYFPGMADFRQMIAEKETKTSEHLTSIETWRPDLMVAVAAEREDHLLGDTDTDPTCT
jgi:hypothetical protein